MGSYTDDLSKIRWLQITLLLDMIEVICFSTTPPGIFLGGGGVQRGDCGVDLSFGVFFPMK